MQFVGIFLRYLPIEQLYATETYENWKQILLYSWSTKREPLSEFPLLDLADLSNTTRNFVVVESSLCTQWCSKKFNWWSGFTISLSGTGSRWLRLMNSWMKSVYPFSRFGFESGRFSKFRKRRFAWVKVSPNGELSGLKGIPTWNLLSSM